MTAPSGATAIETSAQRPPSGSTWSAPNVASVAETTWSGASWPVWTCQLSAARPPSPAATVIDGRSRASAGGEMFCGLSKRLAPGRRIAACTRQPAGSCHCHAATAVPSGATARCGWAALCVLSEIV